MKFIFTCPENYMPFETDNFSIMDNNGVKTDHQGQKYLDAKIQINDPCPLCSQKHIFHAKDLACPFGNDD